MTNIVILSLAVWRLSSLFSREDGPFGILQRFRAWLGYLAGKERWFLQKLFITIWEGIHCIWCNSVWFSAIISLVIATDIVEWIIYTLAISTLAIVFETVINKLKGDKG
jgi:hypothetical protein